MAFFLEVNPTGLYLAKKTGIVRDIGFKAQIH
jgi:hypothetical protein